MPTSLLPIIILFTLPIISFALGLGDVQVESRLNENFSAKIGINSATERDLESLDVSFASDRDYARSGIDKGSYTYKIKIEVTKEGDKSYISLSSDDVFREPLVQLILDVQWYAGRLLKDYSIFLDPPVFPTKSSLIQTEVSSGGETKANKLETQIASRLELNKQDREPKLVKTGKKLTYGPTAKLDTLWKVAYSMRPDTSITVDQMMLAIQAENPQAFRNNNINGLMAGYVLTVTNVDDIKSIAPAKATQIADQQTRDWKQGRKTTTTPNIASSQVESSPVNNAEDTINNKDKSKPEKISTAKTTSKSSLVLLGQESLKSGDKGKNDTVDSLNAKLILAEEIVESITQENENLKQRISHLEDVIEKRLSLINLKDENLAQLQQQIKSEVVNGVTEKTEEKPLDEETKQENENEVEIVENAKPEKSTADTEVKEVESNQEGSDEANVTSESSEGSEGTAQEDNNEKIENDVVDEGGKLAETDTETQPVTPAVTTTTTPTPVIVQKPLLDELISIVMSNLLYIGGLLALIVLWVAVKVFKKKPDDNDGFQESILDENVELSNYDDDTQDDSLDTKEDPSSLLEEETSFLSDFSTSELDSLQNDVEENDPLSEADVFIVYGRYDQAEKLLLNYIESQPEDIDYKVKLLEVYHADNNKAKFAPLFNETKALLLSNNEDLSANDDWKTIEEFSKSFDIDSSIDTSSEDADISPANTEIDGEGKDNGDIELAEDEIDVDDLERQLNEFEEMLAGDFDDDLDSTSNDLPDELDSELSVDDELGLADLDLDESILEQNDLEESSDKLDDMDDSIDQSLDDLSTDLDLDLNDVEETEDLVSSNDNKESLEINLDDVDDIDNIELDFDELDTEPTDVTNESIDNDLSLDIDDASLEEDLLDIDKLENSEDTEISDSETKDEGIDLSLDLDELALDDDEPEIVNNKNTSSESEILDEVNTDTESLDLNELSLDLEDDEAQSDLSEDTVENDENDLSIDLELDEDSDSESSKEDSISDEIDLDELSLDLEDENEPEPDLIIDDSSDDSNLDNLNVDDEQTENDEGLDELSLDLELDEEDDTELTSDVEVTEDDLSLDLELDEEDDDIELTSDVEVTEDDLSLDIELDDNELDDSIDNEALVEDKDSAEIDLDELSLDLEDSTVNNENVSDKNDHKEDEILDLMDLSLEEDIAGDSESLNDSENLDDITDELESLSLELDDDEDDIDTLGSKLDLARAYIDMGDKNSAVKALNTVLAEGDESQQEEAKKLLEMTK